MSLFNVQNSALALTNAFRLVFGNMVNVYTNFALGFPAFFLGVLIFVPLYDTWKYLSEYS